jgi:D-lactate dehydrogenase
MKIAFFDTHKFERSLYEEMNKDFNFKITYFDGSLTDETAKLAIGYEVICSYPNDKITARVLEQLKPAGLKLIALRSAGFNHVDIPAAANFEVKVVRVPAYSPYAVAEYATTMILALNRKIGRASARVHELNFSLEGLIGFDLHGKTVGILGTGRIGTVMAKIMTGFGCRVLACDPKVNQKIVDTLGIRYVSLDEILELSDILTLHMPLNSLTRHLINAAALEKIKKGTMLINTGRGGLIDTKALIQALKSGKVGSAGLDVYEEEETIFSQDLSESVLQDDVLARLMTFPNVIVTAHQAFLTKEALHNIAETTFQNIQDFEKGLVLRNEVKV